MLNSMNLLPPKHMHQRFIPKTVGLVSLLFTFLAAGASTHAQELPRWAGYQVRPEGYVTTPDAFLGRTWVDPLGRTSWVYSGGIGSWFYLPPDLVTKAGTWAYSAQLDEQTYNYYWADIGWLYARDGGPWVWVHDPAVSLPAGHGWAYILYGAPPPEMFTVTSDFSADPPVDALVHSGHSNARPADAAELERFTEALRIGPEAIEASMEVGADITAESGPDGITFTSTAFSGNRFVRLFYHPVEVGLIDLSALEGLTGEIGVTVHASVDLSSATGGFYSRIMNDGIAEEVNATPDIPDYIREYLLETKEVGPHSRLEKGVNYGDVLLEMYTNQPADPAYIELTLPPQGSITVKEVFLHLEPEIEGFADMEARITGGEGATAENTHTATNIDELLAALETVKTADGPSIIYVDGLMALADWQEANGEPRQIDIGGDVQNFSLIGVGDNAILDGIGIKVHGSNIIIENLTMRYAWMQDGIEINDARYVRVSHCTMHGDGGSENRFDEFMSIKNQARYVIISWNHLHSDPSGRGILIGSNDGPDALPNRSVIIHHNWFQDTGSRHPLVRGGYTHFYNNYLDNTGWAANVRTRAKVRLENNYFLNVDRAIFPGEEPDIVAGGWEVDGNIYVGGNEEYQPTESTVVLDFEDDYTYTLDPADQVPAIVMEGAGAGKLDE